MKDIFKESRFKIVSDKYYSVVTSISNFFHWVVKSFQYSIFLWSDRDWDYIFLLKLLKFKITRMRKNLVKNDIRADVSNVAKRIKTTEILLERILGDNDFSYCALDREHHNKKWGPLKIYSEELEDSPDFYKVEFSTELAKSSNQVELENNETLEISKREQKLEEQDYDLLFKYLRKYIRTWWD